jgi:hypothetical protein
MTLDMPGEMLPILFASSIGILSKPPSCITIQPILMKYISDALKIFRKLIRSPIYPI